MGWLRLASHLKMSLDEVKMKTSASQYVLWMEFLEWETNAFDKTCYYLAQIAAGIENLLQVQYKQPKFVTTKDKLIKFVHEEPENVPKNPVSMDKQASANRMKQFFFGLTGLTGNVKKKKRKQL